MMTLPYVSRLRVVGAVLARSFAVASKVSRRTVRLTAAAEKETVAEVESCVAKSAYVHLPFCKRRCYYCDFPVHVVGTQQTSSTANTITQYVQLLCKEIEQTPVVSESQLETLFFGGGTPSLIPPDDLSTVLETLKRRFGFADGMEMSLEADPGTFDAEKLMGYLSLGVNRISLGVQSFDDALLELCGRSHSLADVWSAIQDIQSVQIPSWSLDLISGLPHTTLDSWRVTLERALECHPEHISIYDLQLEEKTPFSQWYEAETAPLPSHELSAEMYALASQLLRDSGYEHYEISNYARPGHRCRHNMAYWHNQSFYGFGLGATSHLNGHRFSRPRRMKAYAKFVEAMPTAKRHEEPDDPLLESLMLRLRLSEGLDVHSFRLDHGEAATKKLQTAVHGYVAHGLVECFDAQGRRVLWSGSCEEAARIRLADPDGFLLSTEILATIFSAF